MAEQIIKAISSVSNDFSAQCQHLVSTFKRRGMPLRDMSREGMMELQISTGGLDDRSGTLAGSVNIERLEGTVRSIAIPKMTTPSRLRYFLDGAQRTFPMFCVDRYPVFAALTSAAILDRDQKGEVRLSRDTFRIQHAWIVPELADNAQIRELCDVIRGIGGRIIDPLEGLNRPEISYERAADDYLLLEERASQITRIERQNLERDLLLDWKRQHETAQDWIVVDGPLVASVRNGVGLVKSFNYQYLTGDEATTLYTLNKGHRTGAFRAANKWRKTRGAADALEVEPTDERVLWYLRFWDAAGHDARHALVRIETSTDFREPAQIDELSSWLLAERAPRATADARWDTLLYPIHLLEKMLKRRIDSETRAWPGARQR